MILISALLRRTQQEAPGAAWTRLRWGGCRGLVLFGSLCSLCNWRSLWTEAATGRAKEGEQWERTCTDVWSILLTSDPNPLPSLRRVLQQMANPHQNEGWVPAEFAPFAFPCPSHLPDRPALQRTTVPLPKDCSVLFPPQVDVRQGSLGTAISLRPLIPFYRRTHAFSRIAFTPSAAPLP